MNGAFNQPLRALLLRCYNALEQERMRQSTMYGGVGRRPLYETPMDSLLNEFLTYMRQQVELRAIHGRRRGRAKRTLEGYELAFRRFNEFLKARGQSALMTGNLESALLRDFRGWLDTCRSRHNNEPLSLATVNMIVRCMRCFVGYFCQDEDSRPYFRSTEKSLRKALGPAQSAPGQPKYFSNSEIRAVFVAALARDGDSKVVIQRRKPGAHTFEQFEMELDLTPVFPWVAMLKLTGARRHELEGVKWSDLDLDRGFLVIRADVAKKTGRPRMFAFADKRWSVAPCLVYYLKALKARRQAERVSTRQSEDVADQCILPPNGMDGRATFPRKVFEDVTRRAGVKLTAKNLRSNFCTRMVAQGYPPAIVAMLVGHSAEVESDFYLTYPHDPQTGLALSDAMGVTEFIQTATERLREPNTGCSSNLLGSLVK